MYRGYKFEGEIEGLSLTPIKATVYEEEKGGASLKKFRKKAKREAVRGGVLKKSEK